MARPRKFDETTRSALIRDAAEQILAGGVESVSLRPLAAKHGCSTTAIYTMFGSRDALIAAVREEAIESYLHSQEEAVSHRSPLLNLLEMGRASRRWALTFPELYNVIVGWGGAWFAPRRTAAETTMGPVEFAREAMAPMNELIAAAIREGTFHEIPVSRIGATLWTGVHGWIAIEMNRPVIPGADADAAYDQHLRALMRAWCVGTPLAD